MKNHKRKSINVKSRRKGILILIAYFILLGVILYHCMLNDYSADRFLKYREQLQLLAEANRFLSFILFFTVYFAIVISSAPFTVILNLFAGYLFGSLIGALLADAAVSSGSYVLYMFSRYITQKIRGEYLHLQIFKVGSKGKAVIMLFCLRLSPFFPASATNMGCGAFGVKAHLFVLTTFLGSFPLILIYTLIGSHIGNINQISEIYDQNLIIVLIMLGLLSLAPLLKKDIRSMLVSEG